MAQKVVQQFGASAKEIRVPMRTCDDVPRFIEKMDNAHRQTAHSTLRFGPPSTQPREDT
jgi:hypothetical protein